MTFWTAARAIRIRISPITPATWDESTTRGARSSRSSTGRFGVARALGLGVGSTAARVR